MNEYKGIMPTKVELTLEQSQQGVSNDVLVLTTVLQPHSSRVGFITTCSYLSFKDIYLASRFKNQESSSIKDKDFRNSDIKDLQSQTKKCSPGRLLALEAFFGRLLALMKKRSLQAFKMMQSMSMLVKTQDFKMAKTLKTNKEKI
ncbi:hypothetical protein Tco_0558107 [Tanacetum coccineum]